MKTVGYFSSYDRGLECLLDMWPAIRKQVPNATLDIAYGWQSYDAVRGGDDKAMRWKLNMIRKMYDLKDQGVTEHGRLTHEELAKLMKQTKVLAYPTEFTEIFMITMTKALMAGCIPVSTGVAAIQETQGGFGYTVRCDDIYTNKEKQVEFIDTVVKALKQTNYDVEKQIKFAEKYDWSEVAKLWDNVANESNTTSKKSASSSRR